MLKLPMIVFQRVVVLAVSSLFLNLYIYYLIPLNKYIYFFYLLIIIKIRKKKLIIIIILF